MLCTSKELIDKYVCIRMKKLFYIFVCLTFVNCSLKPPVNIWERTKETNMIPLGSFIMMHDDSIKLQKLIDEDESILNKPDGIGNSLLLNAAYHNAIKCTRLLIASGVEIDKPNPFGETPLMRACYGNNFDIIKLLVEAGANVNVMNRTGSTPLTFAIDGYCIEIKYTGGKQDSLYLPLEKTILYLTSKGANVNLKGGEIQVTALDMAKHFGASPIEKILIGHGAIE